MGRLCHSGDNVKGQAVISGQQQPVAEHDLLGPKPPGRVCCAEIFLKSGDHFSHHCNLLRSMTVSTSVKRLQAYT